MGTMVLDPREHPHAMRPKSLFIFYTGHLRTSVADPYPDLYVSRNGGFLIQLPCSYRTILLHTVTIQLQNLITVIHKDINWCFRKTVNEMEKHASTGTGYVFLRMLLMQY